MAFTEVAGELNMQETTAAAYKLPCDKGQHSGLCIALLAAVEEFQPPCFGTLRAM